MNANLKTSAKLAVAAIAMFGFGYALVPLYRVFCDVTGLGGRTGVISVVEAEARPVDSARSIRVQFDSNVNGALPWEFRPMVREITVHPGAMSETMFYAENRSGRVIVGQAVPSVSPAQASRYFSKTECFCFTQQVLQPGERREMPVRFVIDPDLPEKITTLTLSYTFFESPPAAADEPKPKAAALASG